MTRHTRLTVTLLCLIAAAGPATGERGMPASFEERAHEPVSITTKATGFSMVMRILSIQSDIEITLDEQTLDAAGIAADTPVTMALHDADWGRAVELVVHAAGAGRLAILKARGADRLFVTTGAGAQRLLTDQAFGWERWAATVPPEADPRRSAGTLLGRPTSYAFEATPLAEAARHMHAITRLSLYIDEHALAAAGLGLDTPVTAAGGDIPARQALDNLLAAANDQLTWRVDGHGIVIVSTKGAIGTLAPVVLNEQE